MIDQKNKSHRKLFPILLRFIVYKYNTVLISQNIIIFQFLLKDSKRYIHIYTEGCIDGISAWFTKHLQVVGGVAVGVAVIQVCCVINIVAHSLFQMKYRCTFTVSNEISLYIHCFKWNIVVHSLFQMKYCFTFFVSNEILLYIHSFKLNIVVHSLFQMKYCCTFTVSNEILL